MSSEITFQNFPELLLDEINRSKISSITSEKILRISAHYFMLLRKMTVELTFENFYLMRSTGLIFLRSPDVRHRHTDTHTQSYRRKDAQTHRCAQTHRHTGTQTHRHTGTQTHRHIDAQMHRRAQTHRHKRTHRHTGTHRHTYTPTQAQKHTQTHRQTQTYTHAY